MVTRAILEGRRAYVRGSDTTANPYNAGSSCSLHWHIAWILAQLQFEKIAHPGLTFPNR